jgi:DNA-binding transcriptional ArsR family regulator
MPKTKESGTAERRPRAAAGTHPMEGLEQVRALSHPLRLRLIELFAKCPRTTKQAAEELGEAPTRLYHHVAALERAGLIRLRETRRNRGTTEKYFEAVSNRFTVGAEAAAAGQKDAGRTHAAMGFVVFDEARNELVRALGSGAADGPETLMAIRGVLRLSKREAKRLQKDLLDLLKRVQTVRTDAPGTASRAARRRYSLTIALLPTDEP